MVQSFGWMPQQVMTFCIRWWAYLLVVFCIDYLKPTLLLFIIQNFHSTGIGAPKPEEKQVSHGNFESKKSDINLQGNVTLTFTAIKRSGNLEKANIQHKIPEKLNF